MTKADFTAAIDTLGRKFGDQNVAMIHLQDGAVHLTQACTIIDDSDETVEYEEVHGHLKSSGLEPPGLMEVRYDQIETVWDYHTYAPPKPTE